MKMSDLGNKIEEQIEFKFIEEVTVPRPICQRCKDPESLSFEMVRKTAHRWKSGVVACRGVCPVCGRFVGWWIHGKKLKFRKRNEK